MQTLNFKRQEKPVMRIELNDQKGTILYVLPPTKREVNELKNLDKTMTMTEDSINIALAMCAKLMSRNLAKIPVTMETIEDWDLYDIQVFYKEYVKFVISIRSAKN